MITTREIIYPKFAADRHRGDGCIGNGICSWRGQCMRTHDIIGHRRRGIRAMSDMAFCRRGLCRTGCVIKETSGCNGHRWCGWCVGEIIDTQGNLLVTMVPISTKLVCSASLPTSKVDSFFGKPLRQAKVPPFHSVFGAIHPILTLRALYSNSKVYWSKSLKYR